MKLCVRFHGLCVRFSIDVTKGDAITPSPELIRLPSHFCGKQDTLCSPIRLRRCWPRSASRFLSATWSVHARGITMTYTCLRDYAKFAHGYSRQRFVRHLRNAGRRNCFVAFLPYLMAFPKAMCRKNIGVGISRNFHTQEVCLFVMWLPPCVAC